ncbi:MAG TPA: hypothetical protein VKR06_24615 [Ktedonosporobacter sp.]|nr:hypothetical protein [Ktedonosporobacter sp.]
MPQQNIEERVTILESKVAKLESAKGTQETRDLALLARIDGFIDDLHRVERVQMRGFETVMAVQREQATEIKGLKVDVQELKVDVQELRGDVQGLKEGQSLLVDIAKDHKKAIDSLLAGQRQIIELLTGGRRGTND